MENGTLSDGLPSVTLISTDVASYEKGLQHKTLGSNLVSILLEHGTDGFTSTSASVGKEYVRYRTSDSEAELQNSISVAPGHSSLGTSDTIRRWLQAVPYIVSGNTWWSQHVRIHVYWISQLTSA